MNRRNFMTSAGSAGFLGLVSGASASAASRAGSNTKAVLETYTAADHRRRLENIGLCERSIQKCLRKHLVTNYIPGHAVYDVQSKDWEPGERDDAALGKLHDAGIGLIQAWSGWADSSWGRSHLVAKNPSGFRRFVDLVHRHGMKIIPYTSTNFFERTDPNFRDGWAWPKDQDLVEFDYHLAHCSPASPGWRAHILPRMVRILEEYGVDGLYNDLGYLRPGERVDHYGPRTRIAEDEVLAFEETPTNDGALGDLLALVYEEVKRRGGIYKLHKEGADTVYTDEKVYDYLWVGEAVRDAEFLRQKTKGYAPYITPQRLIKLTPDQEDETFLNTIPYMRFPILGHGQPGDLGAKYEQALFTWLGVYLPMVEEGTRSYLEIVESNLFSRPLPSDVVASMFANRELYLVIANYGRNAVEIATADRYMQVAGPSARPADTWRLGARSLVVLRRQPQAS